MIYHPRPRIIVGPYTGRSYNGTIISNYYRGPTCSCRVEYQTAIVDPTTGQETPGQRGHNMLTDAAMDAFQTTTVIPDTTLTAHDQVIVTKRLPDPSNELTATFSGPESILLTCGSGFFVADDVGRSVKINGWPELLVTAYNSSTSVTAKARGGIWYPGFTPPTSPDTGHLNDWGVHYTSTARIPAAPLITAFASDSGSPDQNSIDAVTNEIVEQRTRISTNPVASNTTIRGLTWGTTNPQTSNCYGLIQFPNPDTIPAGKKYKVTLTFRRKYQGLLLTGQTLDLGPTIGVYTVDIWTPYVYSNYHPMFQPMYNTLQYTGTSTSGFVYRQTSTVTPSVVYQYGQPSNNDSGTSMSSSYYSYATGSYTAGDHTKTREWTFTDTQSWSCKRLDFRYSHSGAKYDILRIQSDTDFNKPIYHWFKLIFRMHWSRELVN